MARRKGITAVHQASEARGILYWQRSNLFEAMNHWDSYPSGLGAKLVDQIHGDAERFKGKAFPFIPPI